MSPEPTTPTEAPAVLEDVAVRTGRSVGELEQLLAADALELTDLLVRSDAA